MKPEQFKAAQIAKLNKLIAGEEELLDKEKEDLPVRGRFAQLRAFRMAIAVIKALNI